MSRQTGNLSRPLYYSQAMRGLGGGGISQYTKQVREVAIGGGFPKISGTILGGPYNKDYSILGSILGSPHLEKLP